MQATQRLIDYGSQSQRNLKMAKQLKDNHVDDNCTFSPQFFTKSGQGDTMSSKMSDRSKSPMQSVRLYKQFHQDQVKYRNKATNKGKLYSKF